MSIITSKRENRFAPDGDTKALSLSKHAAPKFHIKKGSLYLHQSGQHLQIGSLYAWKDSEERGRKALARFPAAAGAMLVEVE